MAQVSPYRPADTRRFRSSWRLTFQFNGEAVQLVSRERVPKISPGTTTEPPTAGRNSGAWVELHDRTGRLMFHRLLNDPFRTKAELHSSEGKIEVHFRPPVPGRFEVLLPDIPEAATVILYSSPLDPQLRSQVAEEIGRFELRERPEPKEPK